MQRAEIAARVRRLIIRARQGEDPWMLHQELDEMARQRLINSHDYWDASDALGVNLDDAIRRYQQLCEAEGR